VVFALAQISFCAMPPGAAATRPSLRPLIERASALQKSSGAHALRECGDLKFELPDRKIQCCATHCLNVAAMLPCSRRSFAMRALQDSASCSRVLFLPSAGHDLLPIDMKARFCPNRIDFDRGRRLSHAFDASKPSATQQNRRTVQRWQTLEWTP